MRISGFTADLKLSQKAWILISVPLIFELTFVAVLTWLLRQADLEAERQTRAKAVLAETTQLSEMFYEQAITIAGLSLMRGSILEERFNANMESIPREVKLLKRLAVQSQAQIEAVGRVEAATDKVLALFAEIKEEATGRSMIFAARDYRRQIKALADEMLHSIAEVAAEQQKEIIDPTAEACLRLTASRLIAAGIVVNIALAAGLAWFFNQGTNNRLKVLMDNTRRLAGNRPLNPLLSGKDEIGHLDHVFHDMSDALSESARKERAVVEYAKDVICSIAADGTFAAVSPAASVVWGRAAGDLIGKPVLSIIVEGDIERSMQAFATIRQGTSSSALENRVRRNDGLLVEMLWTVHWVESEQSFFCVAHDISDRKEIERLKQEFVSIVGHDLRTPLTSIQVSLSLLAEGIRGPLPEVVLSDVRSAERNVERLIRLINDLLDIARMESGRWRMRCETVSVDSLLERAAEAVRPLSQQLHIKLDIVPGGLSIAADADRLIQVVVNLLSNSLKFSPPGSTISLGSRTAAQWVEIAIKDQGPGIPLEFKDRIFDRFQQVDGTEHKGGSGLGLAICKAIIGEHKGTIGVDSEPGQGSTFWFRLPAPAGKTDSVEVSQSDSAL